LRNSPKTIRKQRFSRNCFIIIPFLFFDRIEKSFFTLLSLFALDCLREEFFFRPYVFVVFKSLGAQQRRVHESGTEREAVWAKRVLVVPASMCPAREAAGRETPGCLFLGSFQRNEQEFFLWYFESGKCLTATALWTSKERVQKCF